MSEVFDRFAKWTARGSRRDVLKYLGGFLGGGFLMGSLSGCNEKNNPFFTACQNYCSACAPATNSQSNTSTYNLCIQNCEVGMALGGTLCPSSLTTCTTSTVVAFCLGSATCCPPSSGGNYYCTNTSYDAQNCGGCAPNGGGSPNSGTGLVCSGKTPNCCSGKCTDKQTDATNCGRCGHACASGDTCCSGRCTNTQTDPKNCGACGNVCGTGANAGLPNCVSGVCSA